MTSLRRSILTATVLAVVATGLHAQAVREAGADAIDVASLKTWLAYLASDELQGRQVYTEGLGLAASYIAQHLQQWGVEPGGDDGSYFQTVRMLGVRNSSRSSVTVAIGNERRTFTDGEGIRLPANMGGRQRVRGDEVMFLGYGLHVPAAGIDDYAEFAAGGKVIVWLGAAGPREPHSGIGRLLAGRSRLALEKGAAAVIAPGASSAGAGRGGAAQPPRGRGTQSGGPDFTTAQRYDRPVAPIVSAQDEFFEFLFSNSPVSYQELKARADRQEPLPHVPLAGVTLTFDIEPDYTVVSTRLSRNVVGLVRGTDPSLAGTYVSMGAHYDHVGYQQTAPAGGGTGVGFGCQGQTRTAPRPGDIIYNGADDDGSGTVALMAIARAFATGARPKRSVLFIWHTAEESGLQGSRYNADFPVVPNEHVVAHLNMDMIGRNRCDLPEEANTVYLVGSDRISTELHNLSEDVNAGMPQPMRLDYELNDPGDPQSLYTRSDHYSYAAKGIPVIFYTTGLHADYHAVTDEIEKIEFDKLARVARLVYLTAARLGNLDRPPARDNRGPRAGRGARGTLAP